MLVAHSPPAGIHDKPDLPHQGFPSFLRFMRLFRPRYLLHGHIHLYRHDEITCTRYHDTSVINVYPFRFWSWNRRPSMNVESEHRPTHSDAASGDAVPPRRRSTGLAALSAGNGRVVAEAEARFKWRGRRRHDSV
ncbi:MAG: hypothetical protein R2851_21585 [Caldilineaceae bacterium]